MPDYTINDIEDLYKKGVISHAERQQLRLDLIYQANSDEGTIRQLVNNLSHEVTEGWTTIKKGVTSKDIRGITQTVGLVSGALQLLSAIPKASGDTGADNVQDYLLRRGVNSSVAAMAGAIAGVGIELGVGVGLTKGAGLLGKAIAAPNKAAAEAIKAGEANESVRQGVIEWMEQTLLADKAAAAKAAAKRSADDEAAAIIESVNAKLKNITATQKILDKAAEAVRGKTGEVTSTSATLDAAKQTLLGQKPVEAVVNELKHNQQIRGAVRDLNKMAETAVVRGGQQLGGASEIGAFARARDAFAKGAEQYQASKINLADIDKKAKEAGTSIADVLNLQFGVAKTPQEIANLSQPVKFYGESFIKSVDRAEASLAKGDYTDFWQAMNEFNTLVSVHWPYMAPRQVAGQALKTYDEPVLSATHFLQQIPRLGSWLGKLKMNTVDEVEANAGLILREMQKIQSPSQIANFSKRVATEMAEKGDEILDNPTFRDYARFYFVNSLMSGTDTIGRNTAGNVAGALWHYPEKLTSSIAAKALNPFLDGKHHLEGGYANEANVFMSTWASSMYDATRYALKHQWDKVRGLIPDEQALAGLLDNRYDLKRFATTGTTNPFSGIAGKIIGTPVSIAQAGDEISRIALYRASAAERLYRNWVSSGSKVPWGLYREEGLANLPPSIHGHAMRAAGEFTFSDRMSALGRGVSHLRELVPGSEFLAPFIRTVDRLSAFQYNRSPVLSILSKRFYEELNSGDAATRAEAIGRILWANTIGAGLFMAAKTKAPDDMNLITGGGPTDRQLAAKLRDAKVHVPYSIWTPAGRIGFGGLAPVRGPLGLVADAAEIWDEIRNPTDASALWDGIVLATVRNFLDMTYTRQLSDIVNLWDNPSRSSGAFERLGANVIKGFIEPAIVRQIFREIDPAVKEVHDFKDELAREVPGWGIPPKRNPLTGEPVLTPPRLLSNVPFAGWFLPTSPIQPADDAFAKKIRELQLKLPDFPESFAGATPSESPFAYGGPLGEAREAKSGVPIPPELRQKGMDYAFGAEDFGMTLNDEAQRLVSDPGFNDLALIDQAEQIRALYHARYGAAVEKLKMDHPELLDAYELKMQQRESVRMPEEDRKAFEATLTTPPEVPMEEFNLLQSEGP